jgi:hypothetical protein
VLGGSLRRRRGAPRSQLLPGSSTSSRRRGALRAGGPSERDRLRLHDHPQDARRHRRHQERLRRAAFIEWEDIGMDREWALAKRSASCDRRISRRPERHSTPRSPTTYSEGPRQAGPRAAAPKSRSGAVGGCFRAAADWVATAPMSLLRRLTRAYAIDRLVRGGRRGGTRPSAWAYGASPRRSRGRGGFFGPLPYYSRRTRGGGRVIVSGCCLPLPLGVLAVLLAGARLAFSR